MDHRIGRTVFAVFAGLLVAYVAYQWITNPAGREERVLQVAVVETSRELIKAVVGGVSLQVVDPLSPNRKVGKVYVFPEGEQWAISGYYRRGEADRWHPYLMTLAADHGLHGLKIQDNNEALLERAALDPLIDVTP